MQVFKVYFKILRRYIGTMAMYIGIFVAVLFGAIIPAQIKQGEDGFTQRKCAFAVFDYDKSELSKELVKYLEGQHQIQTIADDEKETIQDELYAVNVDVVIRIQKGFESDFISGDAAENLEIFAIPNTTATMLFEQNLNSYLSVINTYVKAGFEIVESIEKANVAIDASVPIEFSKGVEDAEYSPFYYFYKYLSWVFISMCVSGITVVLLALDKKEIRERIQCSPYQFMRMNMETFLGVLVTGVVICMIFVGFGLATFAEYAIISNMILYLLNALCIMANALAITFLISKLTDNTMMISLMANVVGLGMAFLCGVFVPLEYLSKTVIKIAHFMPVYWNVRAIELIEHYSSVDGVKIASYMGIQLLFAVAIICVALMVAKRKVVQ